MFYSSNGKIGGKRDKLMNLKSISLLFITFL